MMADILMWSGLLLFVLGGLGFLLAAFKTHFAWGLALIFLPPTAILYLVLHWQEAWSGFKWQLVGFALLLAGAFLQTQGQGASLSTGSLDGLLNSAASLIPGKRAEQPPASVPVSFGNNNTGTIYRCDGRTRCSQMRSCAEATFFLQNCPGVKMDGDGNGIPCEKQWCRR